MGKKYSYYHYTIGEFCHIQVFPYFQVNIIFNNKNQPSELRLAFGNADHVADPLLLLVGKILPTMFLYKLLCVKEGFLYM